MILRPEHVYGTALAVSPGVGEMSLASWCYVPGW